MVLDGTATRLPLLVYSVRSTWILLIDLTLTLTLTLTCLYSHNHPRVVLTSFAPLSTSSLSTLNRTDFKHEDETNAAWSSWEDEDTEQVNMLEVATAIILVSTDKFKCKARELFHLFDFCEHKKLSVDEFCQLVETVVHARSVLQNLEVHHRRLNAAVRRTATTAFQAADLNQDRSLTYSEFLSFVWRTPDAVESICAFNTSDRVAALSFHQKKLKQRAIDKAAAAAATKAKPILVSKRKSRRTQSSGSYVSVVDFSRKPRANFSWADNKNNEQKQARQSNDSLSGCIYSVDDVLAAKAIFDKIDDDLSGSISAAELSQSLQHNRFLQNTAGIFQSIDADDSGTITFDEMLRLLYPLAKDRDYERMMAIVHMPPVETGDMKRIQGIFESLDTEFDATVLLRDMLHELNALGGRYSKWISRRVHQYRDSARVTVLQLMHELFSNSHASSFHSIVSMAPHIYPVKPEEKAELVRLFAQYDIDGDGSITVEEMKKHFASHNIGDSMDVWDKFDANGDNEVTLHEFMSVYRYVWGQADDTS
jgi:Ca2+-binding EF-hand superfamily protein